MIYVCDEGRWNVPQRGSGGQRFRLCNQGSDLSCLVYIDILTVQLILFIPAGLNLA